MRYLSLLLAGSLAACASHNAQPAASANSVDAATATPETGPSFAPAAVDGEAAARGDARSRRGDDGTATATATMPAAGAGASADSGSTSVRDNATALPAQSPPSSNYEADNTRVNARDRKGTSLTPMDQGGSETDRKLTQQIRQAVIGDHSLSFTAKNVKIITVNGKVTLRGPVKSEAERSSIAAAAKRIAGDGQVDDYLEVAK